MTDTDKLVEAMARAMNPIAWASVTTPEGANAQWEREDSQRQAQRALTAIEASGFRVVPVELTQAMKNAGGAVEVPCGGWNISIGGCIAGEVWADMLAASPKVTP